MTVSLIPNALPVPEGPDPEGQEKLRRSGMEAWTEEAIWGHRFYNDETPWLCLVELLAIIADRAGDGPIFPGRSAGGHEWFRYRVPLRKELRYLLFRDRVLAMPRCGPALSDRADWQAWLEQAKAATGGSLDLSYLAPDRRSGAERFASFEAFRSTVELLRGAEIEPERQRRWTSRHLVPQGPDMIAADYEEQRQGRIEGDRRFFARGGELLFLMLNRSGRAAELDTAIRRRLLDHDNRWNRIARQLQPGLRSGSGREDHLAFGTGYLPLLEHEAYGRLAQDWLSLLRLEALPAESLLDPLMRLTGLTVILYLVERACEVLGRERVPPIALDMVGSDTRRMRKLAVQQLGRHRDLTREALEHYIRGITRTSEWQGVRGGPKSAADARRKQIEERFAYPGPRAKKALKGEVTPEVMLERLVDHALNNHDNHLGAVVGFYAQQIGMAVARPGIGRWYAVSDGLLEALVLANVEAPLELGRFLERLHRRYHIVIGPEAATLAFDSLPIPHEELKRNERRLEDRLRVLGLLHRLSDDCAFVHHPYCR
jgi:hypothetical protein